jgi:hypothetical protein
MAIVLSVLLRYTDSDFPFDIFKLFFLVHVPKLKSLISVYSTRYWNITFFFQRQVINSKQFPFRFFSAYEALVQLENDYEQSRKYLST